MDTRSTQLPSENDAISVKVFEFGSPLLGVDTI